MKKIIIAAFLFASLGCLAQTADSTKKEKWMTVYRATATKINDLVNTKLDVKFDLEKSWMYGKAWITLHPHFYPTDSLRLDAKSMVINEISMLKGTKKVPLKFTYDSLSLSITLDRTYKATENYTVYIDYTARPGLIKRKGSAAISGGKGLYFINPLGKDPEKPVQIWTQGETESNSGWVPTIDKPNQKTTDEISLTVPSKFVTLSNGLLVSKRVNADGTRTDTWKMALPHAPYLMMMAVGEFSIIKDSYKGKEVNYYVEKEYAPVARKIFGLTPEMIAFYSRITGVDYPWQKYSQVVVRDYISGAMENTTATLHGEGAQQDARQLVDGNGWEDIIAHELFHMWFGDYVTCESWSNLTVNESMADYSEYLWEEYKHGRDAADEHAYNSMRNYMSGGNEKKDLVRFYYNDREDMFDLVSYQKGGRILNMLRNFTGDSAFFKSLNLYLRTKKFGSAEAHDLRLAFEEVTGRDMNWFWNQWYYGSGHPKLDISYLYNSGSNTASVIVKQNQKGKLFNMPVAIDVYEKQAKKRYNVWIANKADTYSFPVQTKPELINFDGDKTLLCEKNDHKSIAEFAYQYKNGALYLDRREAIDFAASMQNDDSGARKMLISAMGDKYYGLRLLAIRRLNMANDSVSKLAEPVLKNLAVSDPRSLVRAGAIETLGRLKKMDYRQMYLNALNDSSYSIAGGALSALAVIDTTAALTKAREIATAMKKGPLVDAVTNVLFTYAGEDDFNTLAAKFNDLPFSQVKFNILMPFANYLKRVKNDNNFRKGIDLITAFRDTLPEQYKQMLTPYFNGMILNGIASAKQSKGSPDQAAYVRSKLPGNNLKAEQPVKQDDLKKYTGTYDIEGDLVKVTLSDNNILKLVVPDQPEMELVPVSKGKFSIKYMEGYTIEFTENDKGSVTELIFTSPDGKIKAPRTEPDKAK